MLKVGDKIRVNNPGGQTRSGTVNEIGKNKGRKIAFYTDDEGGESWCYLSEVLDVNGTIPPVDWKYE